MPVDESQIADVGLTESMTEPRIGIVRLVARRPDLMAVVEEIVRQNTVERGQCIRGRRARIVEGGPSSAV